MNNPHGSQYLATILAYALPLLQFLFTLLNDTTQKIFLFKEYFVIVSVVTAAICYALINLVRENHYFEWTPFQGKLKREWDQWGLRTNQYQSIFTDDEIKKYITKNERPKNLFVFRANNITQRVLVPLTVINFIIFITIGIASVSTSAIEPKILFIFLSLLQLTSYMLILTSLVVAFALFYYTKRNQVNYDNDQSSLFERAIELARRDNSFGETQAVSLIAHREFSNNPMNKLYSFLITVGKKCYIVTTDMSVRKIILINEYPSIEAGYAEFLNGGSK